MHNTTPNSSEPTIDGWEITCTAAGIAERAAPWNDPRIPLHPDLWEEPYGSDAAQTVTAGRALSWSPLWQGIKLISGDVAKLPLDVFRRLPDRGREPDYTHPAAQLIGPYAMPNAETTAYQFWRRMMTAALLYEHAYAWIERAGSGRPIGLYPLLPDRTAPYRDPATRDLYYVTEYTDPDGRPALRAWHHTDILHIEGMTLDADAPLAMIEAARHDIGLALAARKFTSQFFARGAQLGGILQAPPGATAEARTKLEEAITKKHSGGDKAFRTLVLRDGFKWQATTVDPAGAQLVPLDEAQIRHAARWLGLSPDRLGVRESVSYNSLEASKQAYYDGALSHWLHAIRAEANAKLLTPRERRERVYFIDWNINALLWADAQTRATIANQGILTGRFSVDETRAWENLNPRPDGQGSVYLRPANTIPANTPAQAPEPDATPPAGTRAHTADQQPTDLLPILDPLVTDTLTRALTRLAQANERTAGRHDHYQTLTTKHLQPVERLIAATWHTCQRLGYDLPPPAKSAAALLRYAHGHPDLRTDTVTDHLAAAKTYATTTQEPNK